MPKTRKPTRRDLGKKTTSSEKKVSKPVVATLFEISDFNGLHEFSNSLTKEMVVRKLLDELDFKEQHPERNSEILKIVNEIFDQIAPLLCTDFDIVDEIPIVDDISAENPKLSGCGLLRARVAVFFLDSYRQIWETLYSSKSQFPVKRTRRNPKKVSRRLSSPNGQDVVDECVVDPQGLYEFHGSVKSIALVALESWLRTEDPEFQLQCGRVFDFISHTFSNERVQFGGAYILHLLLKLFSPQGIAADIGRLFKSRDILTLIDFDDPASDCVRSHLIRSFSSSSFLQNDTGRRFLSFVLGSLQSELTIDAIEWIKTVIPNTQISSPMLKSMSMILHGAWRLSDGGIKLALESSAQDLIELAILCEPKTAAKFREVLVEFYRKGDNLVSDLVYRIFSPLLYRFIPVACWKVRFNATALFSVVFPLVDISLPAGEYEAEVERQYSTLAKLAVDAHPEVRRVAVQGVCRVLATYWEMIPLEKITLLLDSLLLRAAKDKSTPQIRAAVLEGLLLVLENPMSHTALKSLLPNIADCIHDASPIVRRSTAILLRRVSQIEEFQTTSIVALDGILARLVKDKTLAELEFASSSTLQRLRSRHCQSPLSLTNLKYKTRVPDAYISAKTLSDLMFDSIFGLEDLPKQVERVLLMAERFPLALLAIVELTENRLPILDRVRLSVALFNFACRKSLDVQNLDEDTDQKRRRKKHGTIAKVLFSVVSLLLGVIEGDSIEASIGDNDDATENKISKKKEPKSKRKPKALNQQQPPSSSIQRDQLGGALADFLRSNFTSEQLKALLTPQSPVLVEALQLISSIPCKLTNFPELKELLLQMLDLQLRGSIDSDLSLNTFINPLNVNAILDCIASRAVDDHLLHHAIIAQYWTRPVIHYCNQLRTMCGLQSLYIKFTRESTSDCCDKNNENRTSSPCTKPAKRQKCSDQKSKTGTSVSTFGCFENVGLTEENPDEQFDVEWDIKTDLLRIIQGIKLSEIISSSRPELIGSITLSQQLLPISATADVLQTMRELILISPSALVSHVDLQVKRISTIYGDGTKARTISSQILELVPSVLDASLRCAIHHSVKQQNVKQQSKHSPSPLLSTPGVTTSSGSILSSPSPDQDEESRFLTSISSVSSSFKDRLARLLKLNVTQVVERWSSFASPDPSIVKLFEQMINKILRNLIQCIGVASIFKLITIDDSSQFASDIEHFLKWSRSIYSQNEDDYHRNFNAALTSLSLIAESGSISPIQLFEPLESIIFGIPCGINTTEIVQRLISLLPLMKRNKQRVIITSRLVMDFVQRMNDRLTQLMKNDSNNWIHHKSISVILESLLSSLPHAEDVEPNIDQAIEEGAGITEMVIDQDTEKSRDNDSNAALITAAVGGIDFGSFIAEAVEVDGYVEANVNEH